MQHVRLHGPESPHPPTHVPQSSQQPPPFQQPWVWLHPLVDSPHPTPWQAQLAELSCRIRFMEVLLDGARAVERVSCSSSMGPA